jgi:hypothetical protein
MAQFQPAMLFLATVLSWDTKNKDRVRDKTNGTQYLLNTYNLDGMRALTNTAQTGLYYIDNPDDQKSPPQYMTVALSVAQLKTQIDTSASHSLITMNIYPSMDSTKATVATTIPIYNFSRAVAVADSGSTTDSTVYYYESGNKWVKARVKHTLAQLLALIA